MAYYECGGNLYAVDENGDAHPLSVSAKDKVIEFRELESITPKVAEEVVDLPQGSRPVTLTEIACKFNLSQKNPVKFDSSLHAELIAEPEPEAEAQDDENAEPVEEGTEAPEGGEAIEAAEPEAEAQDDENAEQAEGNEE